VSLDPAAVQAAVQAYQRVAAGAPDFAPHAILAFEQIGTLGEGGMGVVLRMRDRRLGRQIALKLIRGAPSAQRVQRFRREALLMASLEHPSIPPVYEAGTTPDGQPYLAMRLIEGRPLTDLIREHHAGRSRRSPAAKRGAQRRLLEVLVKVGEALAYAHGQQVIHRDLKPDNVMVGRYGEVMLMDWGLAKRLDDGEFASVTPEAEGGLTQEGAFLGTPGYVAPEQARGQSGPRSDVFSLGALLTEILTGRLPVGARGASPLADLAERRIARPRDLAAGVPRELDSVAARALACDPAERTPRVDDVVASLRAWLADEDVPGHRYGPLERLKRGVRRRPAVAVTGLAALLLLGLAGVFGAVLSQSDRQRQAAEALQRETEREREQASARERDAEAIRARMEQAMRLLAEAESLFLRGESEQALVRVTEALRDEPQRFLLWHAARVCQAGQAFERAKQLLEQVIVAHPPALEELYQLHRVEAEQAGWVVGTRTPAVERLLAIAAVEGENAFSALVEAAAAEGQGRLQEAVDRATRALELNPMLGHAANIRGAARHGLGDIQGAL